MNIPIALQPLIILRFLPDTLAKPMAARETAPADSAWYVFLPFTEHCGIKG
jgi:hypothetical protein